MPDIVFFYKANPGFNTDKHLDIAPECIQFDKIFMPYQVWNANVWPVGAGVVQPTDYPNDLCLTRRGGQPTDPMISRATNLIKKIDQIDTLGGRRWAVIPRVGNGYCWLTEIPHGNHYRSWGQASQWIQSLTGQLLLLGVGRNDIYQILAGAAQGWDTGQWARISFARLPRWFSKQLLHQACLGEIHPLRNYPVQVITNPAAIAAQCHANPNQTPLLPHTVQPAVVLQRLVERVSPTALEFLCVELLKLRAAHGCALWMHVGGVGDGGVDGIGFDNFGNPSAFLSVKWEINSSTPIHAPIGAQTELAYLVGTLPRSLAGNVNPWCPTQIASDIIQFANRLSISFRNLLGV